MSVRSLKDAARREITGPITGEKYLIRKLSAHEVMEANLNAIIGSMNGNGQSPEIEGLMAVATANKMELSAARHVLEHGVISPKIFFGDEDATPEDQVHIRWLGQEPNWLTVEILKFSGHDDDSRKRMAELIKNEQSPVSSMPSAIGTGASLTN
jgi:hypothetical protein